MFANTLQLKLISVPIFLIRRVSPLLQGTLLFRCQCLDLAPPSVQPHGVLSLALCNASCCRRPHSCRSSKHSNVLVNTLAKESQRVKVGGSREPQVSQTQEERVCWLRWLLGGWRELCSPTQALLTWCSSRKSVNEF